MTPPQVVRESWFVRLHDLMPFMVREILLVSSAYDAFLLEEDGRIDERLFTAYHELSLSAIPRLTHVTTAAHCMEILDERHFDLVITVVRLEDTDAAELSWRVKEKHRDLPVVLLAFDEGDLGQFPGGVPPATIDRTFLWTGDAQILIAAIKLVEDAKNVDHDTATAGVQVIVVVEDSLRRYSTFLALLYRELMTQSRSLIAEGLNALHRLMRMRARPKIVHATTFEDAVEACRRHRDHLMALISDVRFPRAGREDPEAGYDLARLVRADQRHLPVLLQSAEPAARERATELQAAFGDKNSPTLLADIGAFLRDALGFGDFVFRLPDRTEVGRARDLYELERVLHTVPIAAVEYHASRNHFSMWLNARGLFRLASRMRKTTIEEFANLEELRHYLMDVLRQALSQEQAGVMADFVYGRELHEQLFVRLGQGSVGGKGRGIAFVNSELANHGFADRITGLPIRIPRTLVIGTDEFDRFLEVNAIKPGDVMGQPEDKVLDRFLAGRLPDRLGTELRQTSAQLEGPLAVRSSSLLEDSRYQPFAGIYATVMLPNNHPDPEVRLTELERAIKSVYASTFGRDAQSYFAATPHSLEEEKMAVVIQEIVGRQFGDRFYPHASGVAQSHNFYPVGPQRAPDGIVLLALGLGHAVVTGGQALRFSPACPNVLPQYASARDFLRYSQTRFHALVMDRPTVDFRAGPESSLMSFELSVAEADGSLALAGSVYFQPDDVIRDNLKLAGPRVVTWNDILKWHAIPLADALGQLLTNFRRALGSEVEIEFAMELAGAGRPVSDRRLAPCLYVLQVRPMPTFELQGDLREADAAPPERVLCRTGRALGHGQLKGIRDVVYVTRTDLDGTLTPAVALAVGQVNQELTAAGVPYMLIGPGRWGSSDPALGIPVDWAQIAGARVIVETPLSTRPVDPSQGTHFLQNLTFLRIGYLTVDPRRKAGDEILDRAWLDRQPAAIELGYVRHIRLAEPLAVYLDGRQGRAVVLQPASALDPAPEPVPMPPTGAAAR